MVRRIENSMSSTPLYDRIIVDRSEQKVDGYTFETKNHTYYSERYSYQVAQTGDEVIYN